VRAGDLPRRDGYAFEVKWDGFRALLSTDGGLDVRSRRGPSGTTGERIDVPRELPARRRDFHGGLIHDEAA
jgi:ATP-dependent DNA ligase